MSDESAALQQVAELERRLGLKSRVVAPTPELQEFVKSNGQVIRVNVSNPANLEAAKENGWKKKSGPKPSQNVE